MNILFLSAWYPTERDQMAGLFVQKHADAVRVQGADVRVVYTEEKGWHYWREMIRGLRALRKEGWRPDVVQMNVITKYALIAEWLRIFHHIPYVIIEHWTGYLSINKRLHNPLHILWLQWIVRHAERVMPVSLNLQQAMETMGLHGKYEVIQNVVDDFFYEGVRNNDRFAEGVRNIHLLHVSCFDEEHKNVCGILRMAEKLWEIRQDWQLTLVGTGLDFEQVKEFASTLNIPSNRLIWTGEIPPKEVSDLFHEADIFILFSNFENAPVVISESLAVGCPVVSSDVGGINEMVPTECGLLVPARDEVALLQAVQQVMEHPEAYNKNTIREYGKLYQYDIIGKKLMKVYVEARANK